MTKQSSSLFEAIRRMASDIILNSTDLLVIQSDIVANQLLKKLDEFRRQRTASPLSVPGISAEDELGLALFFNTVNFCYRDPASGRDYLYQSRDGRQLRRTSAFFTALVESGLQWNQVEQVAQLTADRWRDMLQLREPNVFYLGMERCQRITGMARYLLAQGFKTVMDFVSSSRFEVHRLVPPMMESGFFKDEFLKRAQVAVKMMDTVLASRFGQKLTGMDLLTCMADYRIPQVFYNLGAVELSPALRSHLESGKPVLSESHEELALRATVIIIGRQLAESLSINEAEVDTLQWEYSQVMDKSGQMKIPHMLVATDKY